VGTPDWSKIWKNANFIGRFSFFLCSFLYFFGKARPQQNPKIENMKKMKMYSGDVRLSDFGEFRLSIFLKKLGFWWGFWVFAKHFRVLLCTAKLAQSISQCQKLQLQNNQISAPEQKTIIYFEALFKETLKGKSSVPKLRKSADKSVSQP